MTNDMMMVLRVLILVLSVGLSNGKLSPDVHSWTTADCIEWSKSAGFPDPVAASRVMEKYELNGNVLLYLDDDDLQEEFGLESSLLRKKIMIAIDKLRGNEKLQKGGLTFWEYRKMDRPATYKLLSLISSAPRFAISFLNEKEFPSHALPENPVGSVFEWILIPEYYLWLNRNTILGGLPGFMPWAFFVTLVCRVGTLLASLGGYGNKPHKVILGTVKAEVGGYIWTWVYMTILFPILPWFICDAIFFFSVYLLPIIMLGMSGLGLLAVIAAVMTGAALKKE